MGGAGIDFLATGAPGEADTGHTSPRTATSPAPIPEPNAKLPKAVEGQLFLGPGIQTINYLGTT